MDHTSCAAALVGAILAAGIAYRLTGPCRGRSWPALAVAVFAGLGVLDINGYAQLTLIANSDPMIHGAVPGGNRDSSERSPDSARYSSLPNRGLLT
jgi:hypothetical protein